MESIERKTDAKRLLASYVRFSGKDRLTHRKLGRIYGEPRTVFRPFGKGDVYNLSICGDSGGRLDSPIYLYSIL